MGVFFAFLSVLAYSVANLFGKRAASESDLVSGFVAQYGLVTVFSLLFALFSGQAFFSVAPETFVVSALLGAFGYAGIFALLVSSRHMSMGTSLSIAYGYVVVLYLVNARLFPSEILSWPKLAVAVAFFVSVVAFLLLEGKKGSSVAKYAWLPFVSLVSWTLYFGTANYVVKTGMASPAWSLFIAEGSIFAVAALAFVLRPLVRKTDASPVRRGFDFVSASNGISMAVFLALGTGFLLASYDLVAANLANTVGLFTTAVTAVLSAIVFKERLPRSERVAIAVSTVLLVLFLIVP